MSLLAYLRSRSLRLACFVTMVALLAVMLPVIGVEPEATGLVALLVTVLELVSLVWEWLRERSFARGLAGLAEGAGDVLDIADALPEPSYPEGELAWDALQSVAQASRRRRAELEEEMRDYRRYVELWVHEIKTPLAAMNLTLANSRGEEARSLSREVARVEADVENALYYARSTSVAEDYLLRRCDLDELVRDAVKSRARSLIEARVAVDLAGLDGDEGLWVFCDPKWMAFILGQLIDNAVRYRAVPERDGRAARLCFSASVEGIGSAGERVVLNVTDNGCGISEADLGRVFERGFTGTNGRTHGRSTGMGLYLVRTLCEKMGLAVCASSAAGVGTTMGIAFPRERSRAV
ncbi:MAG: sensor histidine kinase [Coriobacteriaceae bacterium]|nr:sensor histidine kinase [Coriobacteriaceae bacterium]MDD7584987.1 sensor histidine kinase [Coriobacteriaceae bacterium]